MQGEVDDLREHIGKEEIRLVFVQFIVEERVQPTEAPGFRVLAVVREDGELQVLAGGDRTPQECGFDELPAVDYFRGAVGLKGKDIW